MTRLASILGVATVATLVLLSGCEEPAWKTDYATTQIWREPGHVEQAPAEDPMVSLGNRPSAVNER